MAGAMAPYEVCHRDPPLRNHQRGRCSCTVTYAPRLFFSSASLSLAVSTAACMAAKWHLLIVSTLPVHYPSLLRSSCSVIHAPRFFPSALRAITNLKRTLSRPCACTDTSDTGRMRTGQAISSPQPLDPKAIQPQA